MPRSLAPETFGSEYPELLRAAQKLNGLDMPFPSKRDAHLFRLRLYAYFRALRVDGKQRDLIALANYFTIRYLDDPEPHLKIIPSSTLPDRKYIRDFLDLKPTPMPGEPLTAGSLKDRLREVREKKGK